jgi:hypothetical protein
MSKVKWIDFVNLAREKGIELADITFGIPKFEKDRETWASVKYGDYRAKITQPRNLKKHQLFFVMLEKAVDNGFLDHIVDKELNIPDCPIIKLTPQMMYCVRARFKDDVEAARYILKYLLLPLEENYTLVGDRYFEVSSQSFERMDEIEFDGFFKQTLELICFVIGCDEKDLI